MAGAAAACGSDDDDGDETPPASASATAEPQETADAVTYPLTLTDMLGRTVTIDDEPQMVAALSPTTVEYVYAVGAESVTRGGV